jgi:hypothetical protein
MCYVSATGHNWNGKYSVGLKESVGFDKFKRVGLREQCVVAIPISNQLDVTLLSFLFWQLYMFRAFFAHLQESIYCMGSRWL